MSFHNDSLQDVPREDVNHDCDNCVKFNVEAGEWIQGTNMDGVCMKGDIAATARRATNINARKRYCNEEEHFP